MDTTAAHIPPLPSGVVRPLISVVLPTYEPKQYLITALRSVLEQDLGPEQMQIAVVDDASPTVDVAALVKCVDAVARVEIHRADRNQGLAGNSNRCLGVARGHIVHILHQDDWIADGFYRYMLRAFVGQPSVGMAFCRHSFIDNGGCVTRVSHRERWHAGVLPNWLPTISERQRIQCASVLARRSVYEQLGGYRTDLCYALDWEMWVRIAARFAVWYEPKMLAFYRQHGGNESSRLRASGETYRDTLKAIEIFADQLPVAEKTTLASKAYAEFARRTLKQLASLSLTKDELARLLPPVHTAIDKITHSSRVANRHRQSLARLMRR